MAFEIKEIKNPALFFSGLEQEDLLPPGPIADRRTLRNSDAYRMKMLNSEAWEVQLKLQNPQPGLVVGYEAKTHPELKSTVQKARYEKSGRTHFTAFNFTYKVWLPCIYADLTVEDFALDPKKFQKKVAGMSPAGGYPVSIDVSDFQGAIPPGTFVTVKFSNLGQVKTGQIMYVGDKIFDISIQFPDPPGNKFVMGAHSSQGGTVGAYTQSSGGGAPAPGVGPAPSGCTPQGQNGLCNDNIPKSPARLKFTFNELKILRKPLQPLLDWIGAHEGKYTSVNRGVAGDTKRSSTYILGGPAKGKNITEMTIKMLRSYMKKGSNAGHVLQGHRPMSSPPGNPGLLAVGKSQFIPNTFDGAVSNTKISKTLKFSPDVQETLGVYLLLTKRKELGKFLVGIHSNVGRAAQEAALEWASIPLQYERKKNGCARGYGAYCKGGANSTKPLKHKPQETVDILKQARALVLADSAAVELLKKKGYHS